MTDGPARVLYVAEALGVGGAEELVLNLVRRLPGRFTPHVCCIRSAGPIGEEIRRAGVPVSVLGLQPGVRRPLDIWRLQRHVRALRPHIVHTVLVAASLYGRLAARLARVPVVIGTEVNVYARKPARHVLAERLLMRGTDAVIVSAQAVRDFYVAQLRTDPRKVEVIHNAVDWAQVEPSSARSTVRAALGLPADALVAGIVARLAEQKGHDVLLDAVAGEPALASLHLLVVGDGERRAAIERRAAALGLGARTRFAGARRDLGDLLHAMDLFVLPSRWEGLPLALVLAMGAGLPVVASRVGGIPEVVRDGETGLLVPPGDAAALGAALARVAGDPALRARLGASARAFVRPRFGADEYANAVADLYDRLLARGRARR